jgi:hypothetical protein
MRLRDNVWPNPLCRLSSVAASVVGGGLIHGDKELGLKCDLERFLFPYDSLVIPAALTPIRA